MWKWYYITDQSKLSKLILYHQKNTCCCQRWGLGWGWCWPSWQLRSRFSSIAHFSSNFKWSRYFRGNISQYFYQQLLHSAPTWGQWQLVPWCWLPGEDKVLCFAIGPSKEGKGFSGEGGVWGITWDRDRASELIFGGTTGIGGHIKFLLAA